MRSDAVSPPRRMRGSRSFVLILAARALSEAVTFSLVMAFVHAATLGRAPIALWPTAVGLLGVTLVLMTVLRERGTFRQSAGLTVIVIAAFAGWGLAQPTASTDGFSVLSRIVGFGIAGEIYLWRVLGIARGLQRWREVRNGALLALGAIVVASLLPGAIDREGLPALGLLVSVTAAAALSLARSTEELALFASGVRGAPTGGSATGTAFAIGILAIAVAFALPAAQQLLAEIARTVGPPLGQIVFVILLPLGYVAAYLVYFVLWLRDRLGVHDVPEITPPRPPGFGDDLERLREIESMRPYVFGAVEIIIALIAAAFAVALIARLVQERRATLAEGVLLEREAVEGIGLRAMFGTLFPRRTMRRRAPPDDGTRAGAIRRLYWCLLELAERGGPGWRDASETPAEHEGRLVGAGERWRSAGPVVRAFEEVRYGELEPDERTVAEARDALRRVEAAT